MRWEPVLCKAWRGGIAWIEISSIVIYVYSLHLIINNKKKDLMNDETNLEGSASIISNTCRTGAQQSQQQIESADVLAYEERIYQLWDELCDFDIADTNEAMIHCLRSLVDWIGAQNSFWIGAIRMLDNIETSADLMSGWRIKAVETLHKEFLSRELNIPKEENPYLGCRGSRLLLERPDLMIVAFFPSRSIRQTNPLVFSVQ